jgi:hypothetical protein
MAGILHAMYYIGGGIFYINITTDTVNFNLYNTLISMGWNGITRINVRIVINPGVFVYASSTSDYAFSINNSALLNSNITLVNSGYIVGRGGNGGLGGEDSNGALGSPGLPGGPGLLVTVPITLENYGVIAGGGGGGGGGGQGGANGSEGGGGGGGIGISTGGLGGLNIAPRAGNGGNGTLSAYGGGGSGNKLGTYMNGGNGGNGGTYGQPGQPGQPGEYYNDGLAYRGGASGGAAGTSINGVGYVSGTLGDIRGPQVWGSAPPEKDMIINITSNVNNFNLRNAMVARGWNQFEPYNVIVNVSGNIYISSTSTGIAAFTTSGSYPIGTNVTINNSGVIIGRGGNGGAGSKWSGQAPNSYIGQAGNSGGIGLQLTIPTKLKNIGIIAGGGGGGGGGGFGWQYNPEIAGGGGGGGAGISLGGAAGLEGYPAKAGKPGSLIQGGSGGASSGNTSYLRGGNGGNPGLAGGAGYGTAGGTGGAGGSPGNSITGYSNINLSQSSLGTLLGPTS